MEENQEREFRQKKTKGRVNLLTNIVAGVFVLASGVVVAHCVNRQTPDEPPAIAKSVKDEKAREKKIDEIVESLTEKVPAEAKKKIVLPYNPTEVVLESYKLIPHDVKIVSFNAQTKELELEYVVHFGKQDIKISNNGILANLQTRQLLDVYPDIVLTHVKKRDGKSYRIQPFYGLSHRNWKFLDGLEPNPVEKEITRKEQMDWLREISKNNTYKELAEAGIMIKGQMVIGASYDSMKNVLTLYTTRHGFDIPIHAAINPSGNNHDKVPDALIEGLTGNFVQLDISKDYGKAAARQSVKVVLTPNGRIDNRVLYLHPLPNITPRF
jgi:hypothetical protein